MVLQICIACGKQVALSVRSCICGHVMAENVILLNHRLRRNGEKRMRKVTVKLKKKKKQSIEERDFYLGQAEKLKVAEKGCRTRLQPSTNTSSSTFRTENEKRHRQLFLIQETKEKLQQFISSPQFQQRMRNALFSINKKLYRQQMFLKIISTRQTRSGKLR